MRRLDTMRGLVDGVRALETLARFAPLSIDEFARAATLTPSKAEQLMETFRHAGYVERSPHAELYVLTPLAMALVPAKRVRVSTGSLSAMLH